MTTSLLALAALVPLAAAAPLRAQIPDTFTNLQVLPKAIGRDSLIGIMREFSFALGVRCQYCHVGGDGLSFEGVRFADDDDEDKRKARYMLGMVRAINDTLLAGLPDRDRPPRTVQCVTCHGGLPRPYTLEQALAETIERAGVDSAVAHYRSLRAAYYGSGAFDFTPQRLLELARTLGGIGLRSLVRFVVRLVVVAVLSTAAAVGASWLLRGLGEDPTLVVALLRAVLVTTVDLVVFLLLARLFRLQEVTEVLDTVARRLPSRSRG